MGSTCKQTAILLQRTLLMLRRDTTLFTARWCCALLVSLFFSFVYINARERVQSQIFPRMSLLMWLIAAPLFMSVMNIPLYHLESGIYKKEIRNGMYTPEAYILAQTVVMLPGLLVFSSCTL